MELGQWKSAGLVDYKTLLTENEKLKQDINQYKLENNNLKQSVSDYKDYAESFVASYLEYRALEHENDTLKAIYEDNDIENDLAYMVLHVMQSMSEQLEDTQ